MYCINFRRSSVAIDNNRKERNNRRQSEFYRKLDRQPPAMMHDHVGTSNLREDASIRHHLKDYDYVDKSSINNVSLKMQQQQQQQHAKKRQQPDWQAKEQQKKVDKYSTHIVANSQERYNRSVERNSKKSNIMSLPRRKPHSVKIDAQGFERDLQQAHRNWTTRHPRREPVEEKKEGTVPISCMSELDILMSRIPSTTGGRCHLPSSSSSSPTSIVREYNNNHFMISDETSSTSTSSPPPSSPSSSLSFEQRLRNELQKSCRMLDMERYKNLALKHNLEDTERQIKADKGSKSNNVLLEEYTRQIIKLQEEVAHFQGEYEEERQRRQEVEEELEETRQENQRYSEQMDVVMFQHVPSVAPKFKDVGAVDYNIHESSDSVGSYRLGEMLGKGYYGSVRIGSHKKNQQKYAIKLLNKSNINRFKDLQQIATEVHVLKMYRHPNIVHLEEVIHAEENIYVVTELCHMDLHRYHNETGLTLESAREVIRGILRPLHHLHSHGICHLDLKPENILLTRSLDSHNARCEHVRLCDFGLVNMARKPDESKDIIRTDYACGTPGFYCPEMIIHDRFEGRSADMWSLGCIILEITLGFTKEWIDSYDQADEDPAAFQKGLESSLNEICIEQYPNHEKLLDMIHSCLSIDSLERITSEDALKHDWLENISSPKGIFPHVHQRGEHMSQTFSRIYSERLLLLDNQAGFCA
jgi:serine/threonine protein kinase